MATIHLYKLYTMIIGKSIKPILKGEFYMNEKKWIKPRLYDLSISETRKNSADLPENALCKFESNPGPNSQGRCTHKPYRFICTHSSLHSQAVGNDANCDLYSSYKS